jgi:hypothetical protein
LQPTALVHEGYLRLVGTADERHWNSRGHFFGAAAQAMRRIRIFVESARCKQRVKHGGELQRLDREDFDVPVATPPEELLALDEALARLAAEDAEIANRLEAGELKSITAAERAARSEDKTPGSSQPCRVRSMHGRRIQATKWQLARGQAITASPPPFA